jgi:hypothetical protein
MDLLSKLKGIAERHARMKALGVDAIGVTNDRMISPTRAIIEGRETILAGTNNYMGITFDPTASRRERRRSTSSAPARRARASPTAPSRSMPISSASSPPFSTASTASSSPRAIRPISA